MRVMSWNLQTFFDAEFDGNEYSEYKTAKYGWSEEKYAARLDRLVSVIKELDADIVVMEELEKEAQLQDIANRLSGTFYLSKTYRYASFTKENGSSIGCAVLSRIPIESVTVHSIDIRTSQTQPALRPITSVLLTKDGTPLVLLINHWKSKSGGAERSEIWRQWQERVLARLMKKAKGKNRAVIAAGDFNKDISEFTKHMSSDGTTNIILKGEENLAVYSPWISENGEYSENGSYWYKNEWERIDQFFVAGNAKITDFCAESTGDWAYEDGHPRRYQLWNGSGYSDHLPITCTLHF